MQLSTIISALGARVFVNHNSDTCEIDHIFAGDRMSDLLGAVSEQMLIVTHLSNQGMIRLIELMDASAICLLNGTPPCPELQEAAENAGTHLIVSPFGMYESCGIIYSLFKEDTSSL